MHMRSVIELVEARYRGGKLARARRSTLWNLAYEAIERASMEDPGSEDQAQADAMLQRLHQHGPNSLSRQELLHWAHRQVDYLAMGQEEDDEDY